MRQSARSSLGVVAALLLLTALSFAAAACSSNDDLQPPGGIQVRQNPPDAGPPGAAPAGAPLAVPLADAGAAAAPSSSLPPLPMREFQERDFSETESSRDPFRSFGGVFVAQAQSRMVVQRKVLVDHYALDELKLVGLVTRIEPRALLTDPNGFGWVAKVGDFIGKAEVVHAGGPTGSDVAVNWRVDRIRDSDVVFIREDPAHPEIPPTTRVIALRTPEEEAVQRPSRQR